MSYKYTLRERTDKLSFGKYKGKTIEYVLNENPSYILWLDREQIVYLPTPIISEAEEKLSHRSYGHMGNDFEGGYRDHNYSSYYDE